MANKAAGSLTGEPHTFHFVLADGRSRDNRIPSRGFRAAEAGLRMAEAFAVLLVVWQVAMAACHAKMKAIGSLAIASLCKIIIIHGINSPNSGPNKRLVFYREQQT